MIPVLIIALSGVGWAATIEVSGYTKLTDNSDRYDRNPSIAYYDGEYWLFYTKGDDGTTNGVRGSYNPDNDSYVIWYKRAATVAGLASTSETRLDLSATDRPVGFDQRDVSAVVFNSNLYVFASAGFGGSDHPVWYYKWSASWSGPTSLGLLGMTGCGHANVTCDASQVYLVVEDGVAPTDLRSLAYTWNGTVLNGPYTIASGNGVPKITIKGSTLYVVSIASTTTAIEMHTSPVGATPSVWTWVSNPITVSGASVWDPCVFHDGSTLYVVAAPATSSPDRQWLMQTKSIDDGVIWSTEKRVSLGGYGSSYWWDFWPMGYYDGADKYLFFATEGNSPTYGDGEIAYIKMNWDLANDHYFFIQNAVNQAAPSGDVIQVAAGTFPEYLLMYKSITLQGQGVGSTIINASASPGRGIESEDPIGYNVVLQNFTLIGPVNLSGTAYGIKIGGENATAVITNVEVYGCTRSGVDLNGLNSGTITDLNSHHNGAAGLFLTDCSNITINGLTTAGNPWGGTAVATKGTYYTGGSSNVTFSGVLSLTDNLPIYTELNGPPYYAISGLTIPTSPLGYLVGTTANVYTQGYYATAAPALGWGPTAWAKNRVTGNYLVLSGMRIQAAVDAAASGDIIEVDTGTYPENVTINGSMTVKAALSATPVVDGAILINTNNAVTLDSLTIHNGSNLLYGSTAGGIIVAGSGHTIKNCTLVGNGASGYYGIHVAAGTWNNLTIQDNDLSGWHGGLYLNPSSGHVISGNNFHNNIYVGIGSDGISNVSITGNTFSGHTHPSWGEGMGVSAAGVNVNVTGNRFFNNTFGIRNWGPSGTVNATCNYWSTMVYDSILANLSGSVDFEPWNDSTLANCTYTRLQTVMYLTIIVEEDSVRLRWPATAGSVSYKVYGWSPFEATPESLQTTTDTTCLIPVSSARQFFHVTATDQTP